MTRTRLLGLLLLLLLLGAALDSHALTLGRMRGAPIVGQGLDVSVQVTPDGGESAGNLCLEADVFYADARQDPGRVQITIEPVAVGQPVNARIVSGNAIDEPMVTVYLRAGCAQKTSRRYVLLSDIASEPVAAAPQRALPLVAQVPLVTVPPAPAAANSTAVATQTGDVATPAATTAPARPVSARPRAVSSSRPAAPKRPRPTASAQAKAAPGRPAVAKPTPAPAAAVVERQQAGRVAGQSRLRLDPVEVLAERVATLESAASAPVSSSARDPQDVQRLQTLEASVKTLVTLASRNEASLLDMRKRLQQAESDRYANPVLIGLALALLASLIVIALLLLRRNRQAGADQWWGEGAPPAQSSAGRRATGPASLGAMAPGGPDSSAAPLSAPGSLPLTLEQMQQAARSRIAPVTQVDVSLVEMSESTFDRLMQSGATHSAVRKVRATAPAPLEVQPGGAARRLINSDELFDIRQQAEFFVSLGQTDQAVRILENRISENGESSPAAYLDLLKIFHALGLKADFRQVREDFNLLFNAKVRDFASFGDEGRSLEEYPQVLAGIERVWGTDDTLAAVESLMFREQWNASLELFDLAAFRDLLLLHAVAQTAIGLTGHLVAATSPAAARGGMPPGSQYGHFGQTMPVNASGITPAAATAPASAVDAPLPVLDDAGGVDINLSDMVVPDGPTGADGGGVPMLPGNSTLDNMIQFDLPEVDKKGRSTEPGPG
ncbi:MAG: hypothetical protein ABIN37_03725 [Burkholderiaceae bacterium]